MPIKRAWLTPDTTPAVVRCRRVRVPDELPWLMAVNGALALLTDPANWEQHGALTPEEAAAAAGDVFYDYLTGGDGCMIGVLFLFLTEDPPAGSVVCEGQTLPNAEVAYPQLWEVISPAFKSGVDIILPDLRDRFIVGASLAGGGSYREGDTGGVDTVALTVDENAQHAHVIDPHSHATVPHTHTEVLAGPNLTTIGPGVPEPTAIPVPGVTGPATVTVNPATATMQDSGQGQGHENRPPYLAARMAIWVE